MKNFDGFRARPSLAIGARALALALAFGLCLGAPLHAKGKDRKEGADRQEESGTPSVVIGSSGRLSLSSSLAWSDGGTGGVDWVAASGGPEFDVAGRGGIDLSFPAIPWLRTGAEVSVSIALDSDAKSPSGAKPYLVVEDAEVIALAGPYAGAELSFGDFKFSGRADVQGGTRVLDLSEADFEYQPLFGEGKDFWFRAFPALGLGQSLRLSYRSAAKMKLDHSLILWKDNETAYEGVDVSGFLDELKAELSLRLRKTKALDWEAALRAGAKWDSGIVVPSRKFRIEARTDLDLAKIGRLRFAPIAFASEADLPGFDPSRAENEVSQVSSVVEWTTELSALKWSIGMELPWQAWGSNRKPDASLKEWKLTFGIEL